MNHQTRRAFTLILLLVPVLLVAGILMTLLAVRTIAFEVRAVRGDGVMGTFTAQELGVCGPRTSCSWSGSYVSADRREDYISIRGFNRYELASGDRVSAIDVGGPAAVYRPGRFDVVGSVVLTLGSLALLISPVYVVRRARQRRSARDSSNVKTNA
ncbi:hypothetical protein ACFPOI_14250 [Nonomuraea angiospora]|uniref:DUF3592 domain-containing protein n=1 Tax=Nonomuraea angiospora TaxID=46172 RepID=A0ABR9MGN4_9ACTN|nr:hypothetical protein [Nonomuraea angiospora]MBE1591703.1 hypothetical protein [Nonomuraea angiospora]